MRKTKTFDEILFIRQHRPPKMHQRANEAKNPKVRLIDPVVLLISTYVQSVEHFNSKDQT